MKRTLIFAVTALLFGSCASTSDVQKLQDNIADLQEQVSQTRRTTSSKEEVQGVTQRVAEQTEILLRSNTTLVSKVGQLEESIQSVQGSTEQTANRLDRLTQQLTQAQRDIETLRAQLASASGAPAVEAPRVGSPATNGTRAGSEMVVEAPASSVNAIDDYQSAYRDYQKGNFDLAIAGFRDFISQNPSSDLADNASYWVGESLFSQKKYRDAIEQFDNVITRYPKSDKVPGSLLKKGIAYLNLKENAQGIVQLQYVVHEHPKSQEAALARQKLKQLGVETK